MDTEQVISILGKRFGAEHIRIESSGWIRIAALLPNGDLLWPLLLTPQEATFLSLHTEISNEQLFENRLPDGWPYPKARVLNRFQAWRSVHEPETRWFDVGTVVQRLSFANPKLARFFVPTEADGAWLTSQEAFSVSVGVIYPPESNWPPPQVIGAEKGE
jgi:hypothetical protein